MQLHTFRFAAMEGWSVPCLPQLDSPNTVVIVFGASDATSIAAPLAQLRTTYAGSHIVGCSTSGEIFGTSIFDGSLAVAVLRFERTQVRHAQSVVRTASDSFGAGAELANTLSAPDLRGVLVLSDGLNVNGSDLVRGLNSVLPSSVVVTGGLAGDSDRFKSTWVLDHGHPLANRVCAVGLYGDAVRVGHGSKGGWDIFGPERSITRSKGNVLLELDGRPALQLYKEYLGERAKGLPATGLLFPLALRSDPAGPKTLVRTILGIDEAEQSMTFAGEMPQGGLAQLMRANFDRLIDGAALAAGMANSGVDDGATLAIAISCVGRRLVLGQRSEEEVEATLSALPRNTLQIGFYSYGEISPHGFGPCELHNQTMTLTTIREAA